MIPNCELVKTDGTQFLVFKGQDLISTHLKQELYENAYNFSGQLPRG